MFYSKSTGGFYSRDIHGDSIPADSIEITDEDHAALMAGQEHGLCIVSDESGRPVLRSSTPPTHAELVTAILKQARAERAPIMSVLDGLQASALVNDDLPKAQAIEAAKQGLRDITTLDLSGYSTLEEMRLAFKAGYAQLVAAAPDDVKLAFKQVAG